MTIILDRELLQCDTAAITALRYRVQYGESAFSAYLNAAADKRLGVLCRLAAIASSRDPVEISTLARDAKDAEHTLYLLLQAVFASDPTAPQVSGGDSTEGITFDELDVLAGTSKLQIAFAAWYELPIMYLVSVMLRMNASAPAMEEMTQDEKMQALGVTSDRLKLAQDAVRSELNG